MSNPRASIPKFASFRPKPTLPNPVPSTVKIDNEKPSEHESKSRNEKEHRKHVHRPSKNPDRSYVQSNTSMPRQVVNPVLSEVFMVDRKGDPKNLVYGSVHRYDVPPFFRIGSGHVMGASTDLKIDRGHGEDKGVVLSNWRNSKKSREKYVFSKIEREKPRLLKLRPEVLATADTALETDFVPLRAPRGRKRKRSGLSDGDISHSEEERDYRSIYGKAKGEGQPMDEDLRYATESESSGSDAGRTNRDDQSNRQRNVQLSRKVEQFPHDLEAWLALIDHQEILMRAGDDRRRVTNAEIKSTADIKIHMYEKALESSQSLPARERLLLGMMTEGAKIWEAKAQTDRWERIAMDNIDSVFLWTCYLNFKQSTFSSFKYEDAKEVFLNRINVLAKAVHNAEEEAVELLYQQMLYVLLRLTLFVKEAGYTELAVAIWQGLLELNFYAPKEQSRSNHWMEAFKDFWESEVARIGEDGALGWSHFAGSGGDSEVPETLVDEVHDALANSDIFGSWAAAERIRAKSSHVPARTMDEVVEDDPYRVIMFSDIESFMIQLPHRSKALRDWCIDAFLLFCRLPAMSPSTISRGWANDAFVRDELLEYSSQSIKQEYSAAAHDESQEAGKPAFLHIPSPNCLSAPELLFGKTTIGNEYFGNLRDRYAGDNGPLSYTFIRNTLTQLTHIHFTESLAEFYLAFEFHNESSTIKKTAKTLLKQHPSSLRLYNAYAMIEWSRGNKDIARGVFTAALNMSTSMPEGETRNDAILLWQNWAWLCIEDSDLEAALKVLLAIPDGKPDVSISVSPTALLRVKQHLSSNKDFLTSSGDFSHAVTYAKCLALLDYLTPTTTSSPTQGSLPAALSVYTTYSATLTTRSQPHAHELLLQSLATLLTYHSTHGSYQPSLLRTHLTTALSSFPHNTLLLTLYAHNESRLRIDARVRSLLLTTVLTPANETLTSHLFAIKHELSTGTIHSACSAFERALSSPACKHSAGLWKAYFLFCVQTSVFKRRAKEVWMRGLRACPWVKELYLVGLEVLGQEVGFVEGRRAWRVMGELELRVHVDLEEAFEDIEEARGRGDGEVAHRRVARQ